MFANCEAAFIAEVVDLDQRYASRVVDSANDGGVSARSKREENRGFMVMGWREGAVDNLLPVNAVTPVIVRRDDLARGIMQLQNRISQRSRNWERGANPTDDDPLRLGSGDDKATDQNIISRADLNSRGNIAELGGLRCGREGGCCGWGGTQ